MSVELVLLLRTWTTGLTPPALLTDDELRSFLERHLEGYRGGTVPLDEVLALDGGYALRMDGADVLLPQCCGDVSDLDFWRSAAQGQGSYSEAHPAPVVERDGANIILDCDDNTETFEPLPATTRIVVDAVELQAAYDAAHAATRELAERVARLLEEPVSSPLMVRLFRGDRSPSS